jgi:uncharacterized protein (DUF1499 family)
MRVLSMLTIAIAVAASALALVSGPGTRLDLWPWQRGFALLSWGAYAGMAAAALAVGLLAVRLFAGARHGGAVLALAALALGVAAFAPPVLLLWQANRVPPIHDITTDMEDPPAFVALLAERRASPNGAAYGGAQVAAAQRKAYPDIKPLVIQAAPAAAFQRALEAARAMGWEIAASDPATGRIEATAATTWFGFRDDVVVRIRAEGAGSRIDVRSVSRVGESDIGANARRTREYLSRLG